jgi:hypothetical protein
MATETFQLGQNYSIEEIFAELLYTEESQDDPLLEIMPLTFSDTAQVVWEQPENGWGRLGLRGPDGSPAVVQPTGYRQYAMSPGYYGGQVEYGERQLTEGRQPGTSNQPIDFDYLAARAVQLLSKQTMDQVRSIIADVLIAGRVNRRSDDGRVTHAATIDGYAANQVFSPSTGWNTSSTATPIDDLLGWQNTLKQGTDSDFGPKSRLLMQSATVNELLACAQIRTTFRSDYGSTINGLADLNKLLTGFRLPQIEVYDKGYFPTAADAVNRTRANFTRFIPARRVIWDGVRPAGQQKAQFQLTRNLVNKGIPTGIGSPDLRYAGHGLPQDKFRDGLWATANYSQLPPKFEVAMGFNGGPAVRYVTAFAAITY